MTAPSLSQHDQDEPSRREWLLALYGYAREDIRWAKERSWQALVVCYTLFGALLALRGGSFAQSPSTPFILFVVVASALTIWYLCDLHGAAKGARTTTDSIKTLMQDDIKTLPAVAGSDKNHDAYLVAQILCVALAGGVTAIALCSFK